MIDRLNTLTDRGLNFNTPIVVTGATTLDDSALNRVVVCTGTTADYTVGLPPVAVSQGARLLLVMSSALTKLVTLDGNSSETIDGSATRVMWAGEVAELWCNGVTWAKIGGKSIPMSAGIYLSVSQLPAVTVITKLNCDTQCFNPSVASMQDLANKKIIVPRGSKYMTTATLLTYYTGSATCRASSYVYVDGAVAAMASSMFITGSGERVQPSTTVSLPLAQASYVELFGMYSSGAFTSYFAGAGIASTFISIIEQPQW